MYELIIKYILINNYTLLYIVFYSILPCLIFDLVFFRLHGCPVKTEVQNFWVLPLFYDVIKLR
jgi:hypothetical protein